MTRSYYFRAVLLFYISNSVYSNVGFGFFEFVEADDLAVVWTTKQKIDIETVSNARGASLKTDSLLRRCSPAGTCFCGAAGLSSSIHVTIQRGLISCAGMILALLEDFQVDLD